MEHVINNAVSHCMQYSVRKHLSAILRKRTLLFHLVLCYDVKIRIFASAVSHSRRPLCKGKCLFLLIDLKDSFSTVRVCVRVCASVTFGDRIHGPLSKHRHPAALHPSERLAQDALHSHTHFNAGACCTLNILVVEVPLTNQKLCFC